MTALAAQGLARGAARGAGTCLGIIAARPVLFGSVALFGALAGLVGDNALNRQAGRHPHPMLVTRPAAGAPAQRASTQAAPAASRVASAPRIENDPRIIAFPLVSDVQTLLAEAGYYKLPVDGRAGQATDLAIRAFQRDHGLRVDGMATPLLLSQLRQADTLQPDQATDQVASLIEGTDPAATGAVVSDASPGSTEGELVRRIQDRLAKARIADVQPDGILGERTRAAIRTFEALQGMEPTGEPSPEILRRLEKASR
ncbi:peptidoglycan-binding protein [Aureimonas sp. AU4]|uniref:peptidoglycan-binding domain-containing protein n=1 Tax=Aureimonas sp. AU4 TaxID=1638163 RepID=UPI0007857482|nr:peptidoglycan-binding protein [Aureimonas sp. AU4]